MGEGTPLTLSVYQVTAEFPRDKIYGRTGQGHCSCASIPANIAEGCGRDGPAELVRFLHIALGSASELDYHLPLARDLNFLDAGKYHQPPADVTEVKRMLAALITKLRREA